MLQPASQWGCPQSKTSPASYTMAQLCFLWLLKIQDICVCSVTPNKGLFSLEGLHHCFSPGAYHVSTYFPPLRKICMLLFPAPSPCARGISYFGTHGKGCGNISCCCKEKLLSLTKIHHCASKTRTATWLGVPLPG